MQSKGAQFRKITAVLCTAKSFYNFSTMLCAAQHGLHTSNLLPTQIDYKLCGRQYSCTYNIDQSSKSLLSRHHLSNPIGYLRWQHEPTYMHIGSWNYTKLHAISITITYTWSNRYICAIAKYLIHFICHFFAPSEVSQLMVDNT